MGSISKTPSNPTDAEIKEYIILKRTVEPVPHEFDIALRGLF
ncbi:MAG: hypothetical protein WCO26_02570 [Deltaproteobacteria bacterium]